MGSSSDTKKNDFIEPIVVREKFHWESHVTSVYNAYNIVESVKCKMIDISSVWNSKVN